MADGLHVAFLAFEGTGHINPQLPVASALVARGCKVTFFVAEACREMVEALGATWRPYRYPTNPETGVLKELDEAGIKELVPEGTPKERYSQLPAAMVYGAREALPALLEDLRAIHPPPCAVVYDVFVAAAQVVAHVFRARPISFMPHPGPGVMANHAPMLEQMESAPWVDIPRQQIKERYGYDVLGHSTLMEFYSPRLTLVATIEDFFCPPVTEMQKARFGHVPFKFIGSVVDTKVKRAANVFVQAESDATSAPSRFPGYMSKELPTEALDRAAADGRRVVFVSLGTVATSVVLWSSPIGHFAGGNDDSRPDGVRALADLTGKEFCYMVWQACFEAFRDDPSLFVIMSLGAAEDLLGDLPAPPSNFLLRRAVPQIELLQRSHAMLTHGGANSFHEALSFGVPLAVVPLFGDQPPNADAVARTGAGVSFRYPLRTLSPQSLREAFDGLLAPGANNPYRERAQALAKKLHAAGGASRAADAILSEVLHSRAAVIGA